MLAAATPDSSPRSLLPNALLQFEAERPRLLRIARRILGSDSDAEDVVQDAFIRWAGVDTGRVDAPGAFLATTVRRLALNAARAAHRRRVEYVGLDVENHAGPAVHASGDDELSGGLLRLIDRLTPVERAVLLLHECFAFPYSEIAHLVGKAEANCRQIERRARLRLRVGIMRAPRPAAAEERDRLEVLFRRACQGETGSLAGFLGTEARAYSAQKCDVSHVDPSHNSGAYAA
jgi:RNA polymerase sigma-70 factor (ECF subfamily)